MKQKNRNTQNETITGTTADVVQGMSPEAAENVVTLNAGKGQRKNFFEQADVALTEAAASKVQLVQHIREKAEEANALIAKGEESDSSVTAIADDIATSLYRGRTTGVLSSDEVSSLLGESFGWKGKGDKAGTRVTSAEPDKTRSKTPYGWGEDVRKRVVRAVGAHAFVNGDVIAAGAFFKGLEPSAVKPILNAFVNGNRSIFTVYKDLQEMKQENAGQRPRLAFDPKRIAQIAAMLGADVPAAIEEISHNAGLRNAYLGLYRMLGVIGRELTDEAEAA